MPFLYGSELKIQKTIFNNQQKKLTIFKIDTNLKFWLQIGLNIGTTILSFVPFLGSLAKFLIDVIANLVLDTIFAIVEKQSYDQILTNFALNLLPSGAKILKRITKFRRIRALFFAKQIKNNTKYQLGVKKLLKNQKIRTSNNPLYKEAEKQYLNQYLKTSNKFNKQFLSSKNFERKIFINEANNFVKKVNQNISKTNNTFRALTNSRYFFQKAGQKIFKKLDNKFGN